ncbi:flavin reductase family protein [Nocardioides sp. cx-173]|uniref:flavin reductase family protein n=1 Tax=Nocardioides sp. cx-173 TaxID=2898796 RepID=UPI001E4E55DE|nr:flavin reductase [Nocardioides sp. cx-173]MCD4524957.1 flavin reductase family protein [Nocardioides sp. cx-173]UGB43455.1 flavin reductase family protein [Nocardioides sp. cx-173]
MTIHSTHPFADADPDPVRRLRGRLGGAVSLWTAGAGRDRSGLTVTSLMLANGEPAHVLALLDPDADLTERLLETGRGVVQLLSWPDRDLADAFAGTAPAPGGPFRMGAFEETEWGPRLASSGTWAAVSLADSREVGWSLEVTCRLDSLAVGEDDAPLLHRRGRYLRP